MKFEIYVDTRARQELQEAADWYEEQSTGLGSRFIDEYLKVLDYLETHPKAFTLFERDYRQAVMKVFPFVVVYKVFSNHVNIVAIYHTHKNPRLKLGNP